MNILDENISKNQRQLLEGWRVSIKQIGVNVGHGGMKDEEILPFLHQIKRPTFFTRDDGFFKPQKCHARYCLVYLDVEKKRGGVFRSKIAETPDVQYASQTDGECNPRISYRAGMLAFAYSRCGSFRLG